jgi:hypothetical protein
MKLTFLVLGLSLSYGAYATMYAPPSFPNEAPHLSAQLSEVNEQGVPIQTFVAVDQKLTLNYDRRGRRPSSFLFTEMSGPPPCSGEVCIMMAASYRSLWMPIVRSHNDRCGSHHYLARDPKSKALLYVQDNLNRRCRDKRPARWEVSLREGAGLRYFHGEPRKAEVVSSDCSVTLENMVCTMLYLPAVCRAATVDNGMTPIEPLEAEGSNSCHAMGLIKRQACARGIDPARLGDRDFVCVVKELQDPEPAP